MSLFRSTQQTAEKANNPTQTKQTSFMLNDAASLEPKSKQSSPVFKPSKTTEKSAIVSLEEKKVVISAKKPASRP
jgi:hypothetical protein